MPEGDSIHRVAQRLQTLVGEQLEVETPHPRGACDRCRGAGSTGAGSLGVEAVGKNLLLRFEDGLVLRSHLRMKGRWQVIERNGTSTRRGMPWLVLRGASAEAILWHGPVLELDDTPRPQARAGHPRRAARPRRDGQADARRGSEPRDRRGACSTSALVAGIGNMWRAEALWRAQVSPWRAARRSSTDDELRAALAEAAQLMRRSLDSGLAAARRLPPRPAARARAAARPITLARPGRREPHRVLVPHCQGGGPPAPCK